MHFNATLATQIWALICAAAEVLMIYVLFNLARETKRRHTRRREEPVPTLSHTGDPALESKREKISSNVANLEV